MQAATLPQFGDANAFEMTEIPMPRPAAGQLLVRVKAAGINPVDYKTRSGKGQAQRFTLPAILGWDIAGQIVDAGVGAHKFIPGDRVFGLSRFPEPANAYAQFAVVQEQEFARIPDNISDNVAGGTPLAALTAWEALYDHAQLQTGQRILIHAAAGGVGHIAVQLAHNTGAYVIGTASAQNHAYLRELGVDECIDYHNVQFEKETAPVDVVLDAMGGDTALRSLDIIKPGGIMVSLPSMFKDDPQLLAKAREKGVRVQWMFVRPSGERMEHIANLMASGKLQVKVDAAYPLREVAKAHQALESHHIHGKVVLIP
ncbi:MAG TPA: NADP-dependent oxidoreductase [Chitinophaga sp.]|uniref:NADP-dependent oxidoreductase n=1 Tax=Chitinophaga sp. TaxID=1869181 RepID=UPI002DBC7D96|nr:NADP-dependent oxidoreductase [Chitinophaga sp.]HEU4553356.1 NADP-dependent oxidoreductase [Chitinophaga sp.]